jgi:putative ATP-dependent endonuclease of OLD family
MIVERVEVKNFRCVETVDLACENLTILVGRNGAGKSSLLKALQAFYDLAYQFNSFDYFAKDPNREIRICVTYSALRPDELSEFASYLTPDRKLVVTKVATKGGIKYVGNTMGIPQFQEIRALKATEKRDRLNELIDGNGFVDLGPRVKTGAEADRRMGEYEETHRECWRVVERAEQFVGPANVVGGKLDKYTKFVLIPAVRDAASEVERKGAIHQLIDVLVARSVAARADIQQFQSEFEARAKALYSRENLTELSALAAEITKLFSLYAPGTALDLDFDAVAPPKMPFPTAAASVLEDEFKCPIDYCGHGVQRALVLALLQQIALVSGERESPQPDEVGVKLQRTPDLILAIEEPELYLHPARSRYLAHTLNALAEVPQHADTPSTQVMYATHSPYFLNLESFERIRLARKVPTTGVNTLQCQVTQYTRGQAATALADIHEQPAANFSQLSFTARATPVMTSLVNEGFFADVVVVVEGATEAGLLCALQELMGQQWERKGIVVVSAEGKTKLDRPVVVFRGLSIPTYFIFDGDAQLVGKKREAAARLNRAYLRMAGTAQADFPSTVVEGSYAVFQNNIESEIEAAIGPDLYIDMRERLREELGYDDAKQVLKNISGAAEFVRRVYATGATLPILEDIVRRVTASCGSRSDEARLQMNVTPLHEPTAVPAV